jgi:transcriptional regulator with XRE-family HTH domain
VVAIQPIGWPTERAPEGGNEMEARSPESLAVAEAIRDVMKRESLSGVDLADRLETIRGSRPGDMWISKRRHGSVHLVRPKTTVITWEPTEDLRQIAQALGVPVEELISKIDQSKTPDAGQASNTAD